MIDKILREDPPRASSANTVVADDTRSPPQEASSPKQRNLSCHSHVSRPACVYEDCFLDTGRPNVPTFRLIRRGGKVLVTSGFTDGALAERVSMTEEGGSYGGNSTETTAQYLYAEEAIFTHERGVLDIYRCGSEKEPSLIDNNNGNDIRIPPPPGFIPMNRIDLFRLLSGGPVRPCLSAYAVYSYLRSQSYVVLRHVPRSGEKKAIGGITLKNCKHDSSQWSVRTRSLSTPPPFVIDISVDSSLPANDLIAYDVYAPSSQFRKTDPGPPDFCVMIVPFASPCRISLLFELGRGYIGDVPLRIATVSDGAVVIMYAVAEGCIPDMRGRVKRGRQF